jgi:hypothetical protein
MIKRIYQALFVLLASTSCSPDYGIVGEIGTEIVYIEVPVEVENNDKIWVDHFFQPTSANGVDILWVIDMSGSMQDNEEKLLAGIEAMMKSLPVGGWRLNMISNSPNAVIQDQQFPLVPGDTFQDAKDMYDNVVQGHLEMGFDSLEEYMFNNPYAPTWMRYDAALLVVFVSDEEDQSNMTVTEFVTWYANARQNVYLASIVNIEPADSLCPQGNSVFVGYNSMEATRYFNGVIVDICSDDWSPGVTDASVQVEPYESYELSHIPSDRNSIRVFIDGVPNNDWHFVKTENVVYFDVIPEPGTLVEMVYDYDGSPFSPRHGGRPYPTP